MPISQSKSIIVSVDIDWPVPTNIRTNIRKKNKKYILEISWDVVDPYDKIFEKLGYPGYESVTWELMINNKIIGPFSKSCLKILSFDNSVINFPLLYKILTSQILIEKIQSKIQH